jgi:hypothetical protein
MRRFAEMSTDMGQQPPSLWPTPGQTPGQPQGQVPGYPPGQVPGYPPGYGYPPQQPPSTNGLAIASLVCGLGQFMLWGVASLAAIITGHIALGQIKRTQQGGRGMAIAGIVLGYIGLAVGVLLFALVVVLAASAPRAEVDHPSRIANRFEATIFVTRLQSSATSVGSSPRNPDLIRVAAAQFAQPTSVRLADGTAVQTATARDYKRAHWRVEVAPFAAGETQCVTIPATVDEGPSIAAGPCS